MGSKSKSKAKAIGDLFDAVSLGAPEKAVGFLLWRVVHRYVREVDRAMAAHDLTHLQFSTLAMVAWLSRSDDPVTQIEISRFAEIQPMQVSHMLKTLEKKGMVVRRRSFSNVRANDIDVTDTGLNALRMAMPVVLDIQRRLFGDDGSLLTALQRCDL